MPYACIEEDVIFRYHSLSPSRIPPFTHFHTLSNTMRYYLPEDNRTFVIKYSHLPSSSPSSSDFVHKIVYGSTFCVTTSYKLVALKGWTHRQGYIGLKRVLYSFIYSRITRSLACLPIHFLSTYSFLFLQFSYRKFYRSRIWLWKRIIYDYLRWIIRDDSHHLVSVCASVDSSIWRFLRFLIEVPAIFVVVFSFLSIFNIPKVYMALLF